MAAAASPATALVAIAPAPAVIDTAGQPGASAGGGSRTGARARAGTDSRAGAAGDVGAARGSRRTELGEQKFLGEEQGRHREDRGQRAVVVPQLLAEGAAAFAAADVAAGAGADLAQALGGLAELEADLLAAQLARLGGLGERDPGAHQQRLHRRDGRFHRVRDLLVGERVDLAQQQRRALRLRAAPGRRRSARGSSRGASPCRSSTGRRRRSGRPSCRRRSSVVAAEVVQRAVARDPVQPRAHVDLALVGQDRVEGRREDLLEDVLRVLRELSMWRQKASSRAW